MAEALLHILNGDGAVAPFLDASILGEAVVWREAMMMGPCPGGEPRDAFLDLRANHLAEAYGANPLETRLDLAKMDKRLDRLGDVDEVILWFEDDLFCHVNLWYLLERIDADVALSLVCGEERPGECEPEDFDRLFDQRRPVGEATRSAGRELWRAYASDTPERAAALVLAGKMPGLPFASAALRLHLERFPAPHTGLGRIQRRILDYGVLGADRFGDLFRRFLSDEAAYGIADAQLWLEMATLARGDHPLLEVFGVDDVDRAQTSDALRRVRFAVTDLGRAVLAGERDAIACRGTDTWLGGVHLEPGAVWRWDPATSALVPPEQ